MLYIAINVIFNAFILSVIFALGGDLINIHIPDYYYWIAGYFVSAALTIIGYTQLATDLVGIFMQGRKMIGRERQKLEPLFRDVIERVNSKYATTYRYEDFKIRVTDDKVVNAFALGYRNITINKACFEVFTDCQLKAIIAHEMGHLYYRDSVHSIALIFSSFGTRVVMWMYGIFAVVQAAFARGAATAGEAGIFYAALSYIPILIFLPIVILNWVSSKVFTLLNMAISRKAEYRADNFAASVNLKHEMIEALEVLDSQTMADNSFLGKLMATHPAPMQRIGALEDGEIQKQKLGGLALGSALTNKQSAGLNITNEVIRLTSIILIVGVIWSGYWVYGYYQHPNPKVKTTTNLDKTLKDTFTTESAAKAPKTHHKAIRHHRT